jgi:acyl-CoA thioester hydrolase
MARRHTYLCPVRWFDLDAYQHVNNVQFLRFLEEARVDFLFTLAPREGTKTLKEGVVISRHEIDYKHPLQYRPAPVPVHIWVTEIRAASFTLAYEVSDDDTLYARASSVLVPYDFVAERPRRITAEERGYLEEYVEKP